MLGISKKLKFDDLLEIYPENLCVEFSEKERETALSQAIIYNHLNDVDTNRIFVNRLCLNTFVNWLEDEPELREKFHIPIPSQNLDSQWEFVNGIDLNFNQARLVLVPNEHSFPTEFRIPQEWVDIPNWAGNYYLAVQLNIEEAWLRIRGFISYEQVREKAQYDAIDRTYCIDNRDLIADIDVMWVAEALCPLHKPQTQALPSLSEVQAQEII